MTKAKGIVLNRMYVGDYLSSNLGHEVINLYQADNGCNYIYLNATGDFIKAHQNKIEYMLFVKYFCKGAVEVIGMATGLKDVYNADYQSSNKYSINEQIYAQQKEFIEQTHNGITYGGVSILDIFNQEEQQNIYITYQADKVWVPRSDIRIFIRFYSEARKDEIIENLHKQDNKQHIVVSLIGYQQAKASLKQYIYKEGTYKGDLAKEKIEEKKVDYQKILSEIILKAKYWVESNNQINEEKLDAINQRTVSLFDICQIQNSENDFSNALAYFMMQKEYRQLWCDFFAQRDGQKVKLESSFTVAREESSKIDGKTTNTRGKNGGRIDLLIRDSENLVIIENKIKSDINSVEGDDPNLQLGRYLEYATWLTNREESKDYKKRIVAYILTPEYNFPNIPLEMKDKYDIITYKEVYEYLQENYAVFKDDINFVFFFEAMQRHTFENVNDYLYHEMNEKFLRRIKEYRY